MPPYTLEKSKIFWRLAPPVVWERDSYSPKSRHFASTYLGYFVKVPPSPYTLEMSKRHCSLYPSALYGGVKDIVRTKGAYTTGGAKNSP